MHILGGLHTQLDSKGIFTKILVKMQHKNNTPVNKSVYNLFATGCCVYMTATFLDLNLQRIVSQAEG